MLAPGLFLREFDGESGAFRKARTDANLAAVKAGKMLDDREAESCSANFARAAAIRPVKALENAGLVFGQNPFAGIGNGYDTRLIPWFEFNGNRPAGPVELNTVIDKVVVCSRRAESQCVVLAG
jgi:hypothetical protein